MKARELLPILVITALLVVPVTSVLSSDDSDAATASEVYRGQLTPNQQIVYDAFQALDPAAVSSMNVYGASTADYAATVTVPATYILKTDTSAHLTDLVREDMIRAYQATFLDNPMAWWAWSTDDANVALFHTKERIDNNHVFNLPANEIAGFTFYVYVSATYFENGTLADKVNAVNDAVNTIVNDKKVSGDNDVDKIRSINSFLCSGDYVYDTEAAYCNSVYGTFVAKSDDHHKILCSGFSQGFKMLCDRLGVYCVNVVGTAAQDTNGGHMWNYVKVDCKIGDVSDVYTLAVDVTFDKTGGNNERFLLSGAYTVVDGKSFTQIHQAFAPLAVTSETWVDYAFTAPVLNGQGYTYPAQQDIFAQIMDYAPWILIAIICLILAYILWTIGRRGE